MNSPGLISTAEVGAAADTVAIAQAFAARASTSQAAAEPPWLTTLREASLARFRELGFPTLEQEDWRYTDLAPLRALPFRPTPAPGETEWVPEVLRTLPLADRSGPRLVFVNGHFRPGLSAIPTLPEGALLTSLSQARTFAPSQLRDFLTRNGTDADSAFLALNLAFLQDGAVVRLPAGCVLPEPIRIVSLNRAAEPGQNVHARHLILADQGSEATVLEHHAGLAGAPGLTNTATDVVADEGARLEYVKLQDEPAAAFHVGSLRVWAGKGSSVLCHSFALGARLARQDIVGSLAGEGGEAVFNGLYLGHDERLLDHHLTVEHVQPAGVSHEYFNGILADGSQGVFFGRIRVHPRAQKTDAKQTNKNLLLSDRASIHTRPQLEIHADDVKCTHGATIGQLSPEAIFYLRARGVPLATARRMLIHAFAGEIIDRVRCTPARDALDRLVWDRLERDQHVSAAP